MENTASPNSEKTQILEEETTVGKKEREEIQLPKNKIKEVIYCSFCSFPATYLAIRKNGKVISCCKRHVSLISIREDAPYFRRIIQR